MKVNGRMICKMDLGWKCGRTDLNTKAFINKERKMGKVYENYYCLIGKYIWSDGGYYQGDWIENKITGYGVYIWTDGRKYDGRRILCQIN